MTRGAITLRAARLDDAPVLARWETDPDVMASSGEDSEDEADWHAEIAADPPWRAILVAEEEGRAVGVIIDVDPALEDTHYWGDCGPGLRAFDIWIGEANDRGRGLGAKMMQLALARAFSDPAVTAVIIDPLMSNARALRFYRRIGFTEVGERWFGNDHCLVMRIGRAAGSVH